MYFAAKQVFRRGRARGEVVGTGRDYRRPSARAEEAAYGLAERRLHVDGA